MDIDVAQKPLGKFLIDDLKQCILDQPSEAWTEQFLRQRTYEVHRDTESIVMLFCEESWPKGEIHKDMSWDRLSEAAMPIINAILFAFKPAIIPAQLDIQPRQASIAQLSFTDNSIFCGFRITTMCRRTYDHKLITFRHFALGIFSECIKHLCGLFRAIVIPEIHKQRRDVKGIGCSGKIQISEVLTIRRTGDSFLIVSRGNDGPDQRAING